MLGHFSPTTSYNQCRSLHGCLCYSYDSAKQQSAKAKGNQSEEYRIPLIESGNPLTGRSPDVWYQPVTYLLEIFLVTLQIACQQLLLAKDA